MTAHKKQHWNYAPVGSQPAEVESGQVLTQRTLLLVLLVAVLTPFVLARLFISHVSLVRSEEYTEPTQAPKELDDTSSSPEEQNHEEEEVDFIRQIDFSVGGCNIWKGEWIHDPSEPGYTNATCPFIQGHQNCLKNGRPDHQYLYWKWKPNECELPLFDAKEFFKLVSGKAWAFIGDSISRNHFQSFLCFLAQVPQTRKINKLSGDLMVLAFSFLSLRCGFRDLDYKWHDPSDLPSFKEPVILLVQINKISPLGSIMLGVLPFLLATYWE